MIFLTRHILLRCDSSGDLYLVTKSSTLLAAFVSTSFTTWHQRVGHPEDEVLHSLSSCQLISCNKAKSTHVCHACQLGKHVCLYMHDMRKPHFAALKHILRYVQGTLELGLHLYASATTSLVGYTDADWAGCPSTRSAEAKYRCVANVVTETAWIRNILCSSCSGPSCTTTFAIFSATIPGNPGRLVVGDDFPGRHVAWEKSNGKARMGYLPGRLSRATTSGPHILVK
nr:ribonuclease H-like domain-containing protein [Tanacetum cinerariifolium]